MSVLLDQIDAMIAAGNLSWLSAEWQRCGKAAGGQPTKRRLAIDTSKLHRNPKLKSGFQGVYANGQGFQAVGRRGEYLVRCSTAEEAAWRRYLHYAQHALPYGELELTIDDLRKCGEQGSDTDLRRVALETAQLSGTLHLYLDQMTEDERRIYSGSAMPTQMAGFAPGELEAANAALAKDGASEAKPSTSRKLTVRKAGS